MLAAHELAPRLVDTPMTSRMADDKPISAGVGIATLRQQPTLSLISTDERPTRSVILKGHH